MRTKHVFRNKWNLEFDGDKGIDNRARYLYTPKAH
jgi:hypothetical protein